MGPPPGGGGGSDGGRGGDDGKPELLLRLLSGLSSITEGCQASQAPAKNESTLRTAKRELATRLAVKKGGTSCTPPGGAGGSDDGRGGDDGEPELLLRLLSWMPSITERAKRASYYWELELGR